MKHLVDDFTHYTQCLPHFPRPLQDLIEALEKLSDVYHHVTYHLFPVGEVPGEHDKEGERSAYDSDCYTIMLNFNKYAEDKVSSEEVYTVHMDFVVEDGKITLKEVYL